MQKTNRLLYLLAAIKFLLPLLLQDGFYQPHRDEYLYLSEGQHPAWGYLEVPPLLSVFAWLTNHLGGSAFWIKLWPNLTGVCTLLLTGKIIQSLGGRLFAVLLGCLPLMLCGYLRLFYLLHPNFLDVFFWTLQFFSLIRYVQSRENKWLYLFGAAAGLGMMSKYSSAFCILSLLAGLLITRERRIFLNKHFYGAALLALIIFLPNLLWQYNHRFPIVNHMEELHDEQLKYNSPVAFIISQLMLNLQFVFVWMAGLLFALFSQPGKAYRFAGWAYLFIILILIIFQGKDYYASGAYPFLFAFGGFYLEQLTTRLIWVRYVITSLGVAACLLAMPLILPVIKPEQLATYYKKIGLGNSGVLRWEDQQVHPLPQDFADMIGWKEMAEKAARVYHSLPPGQQQKTLIFCRAYYTAGALNYYGPAYGLPTVYSDNASFLFWMPGHYNINNLLLIGHNLPGHDEPVFQQFEKFSVKDSVAMPLFRENGMRFILFEHANASLNPLLEREVAGLKAKFRR